jgi:hypothetical protein
MFRSLMENNMTKTPQRMLLTVLLACSMLVAQAAAFGGASTTHAATTGTSLFFASGSTTTNVQGNATGANAVTLQGTGFKASSPVTIFFNAPYTTGGGVAAGGPVANEIVAHTASDPSGNIGTSTVPPGTPPAALTIPASVPAGTYAIVATDGTAVSAPVYYTVTGPTLTLSINGGYTTTPPAGSNSVAAVPSTPLQGEVIATATGLNANEPVVYDLEDIASSGTVSIPLSVVGCPAFSSLTAGPAITSTLPGHPTFTSACYSDNNGAAVNVALQLPPGVTIADIGQTWQVVAADGAGITVPAGWTVTGNAIPAGVEGGALAQDVAGLHIDNTLASVTLSNSSAVPGGAAVTITGGGFAANTPVTIAETGASSGSGVITTVTSTSSGQIPAGTTYAVPVGSTGVVTIYAWDKVNNTAPGTPAAPTIAGQIPVGGLPSAAVATLGISTIGAVISSLVTSPATTASLGQTVVLTATGGFSTGDVVTVAETTSDQPSGAIKGQTCGAAYSSSGVIVSTLVASSGTVTGSVPISACLINGADVNLGNSYSVTITVKDTNTNASASATLAIRTPSVTVSQLQGTTSNQVVFAGTGFEANENVAITYNPIGGGTPSTAGANNLTVTADNTGAFNVTVTNAFGSTNGYYTIVATGLTSGLSITTTSQVNLGGYLVVPATVVPGQVFVITGTVFAAGAGTASVNFAPTASTTVPFTVNASGVFSATITVPTGTTIGTYTVSVTAPVPNGSGGSVIQTRTAPISVVALPKSSIGLSSATGQVGGTVVVTATGYAPNEPIAISIQYTNSALSGTNVPGTVQNFTADNTGSLSATYTLQSSASGVLVPGSYNIAVTGVNSGTKNALPITINGVIPTNPTSTSIYFAEGFTGSTAGGASANFNEAISILNSNDYTTTYTVSYFKVGSSTPLTVTGTIGAFSVVQRSVNTDVGPNAQVAAEVSAPAPIAAERIITRTTATGINLGASTSLGQTLNLGATAPASGFDYYFAAGAVQLTNEEYLTILNPNATAASVSINILPETAISSTTATSIAPIAETVPAQSRLTVPLRATLLKAGAPAGFQFGMDVNSTLPIAVENVVYQGDGTGSAKYGSTTVPGGSSSFRQYLFAADFGVAPSTGLASGAIGTGNDVSEVDIINPGAAANGSATVTVSFFAENGSPINSQQIQVDGMTRETVSVNDIAGVNATPFSVVVTSDKNIYVELPVAFGGDPSKGGMYATEDLPGAEPGLTSAAFPYLDSAVGTTSLSSTVFLYNPGATSITVNAVYSAGTKSVTKSYTVAANSVTQVNVAADTAGLGATTGIGGYFLVSASTPGSLVAFAQANTSDYKWAVGTQGTFAAASFTAS